MRSLPASVTFEEYGQVFLDNINMASRFLTVTAYTGTRVLFSDYVVWKVI